MYFATMTSRNIDVTSDNANYKNSGVFGPDDH